MKYTHGPSTVNVLEVGFQTSFVGQSMTGVTVEFYTDRPENTTSRTIGDRYTPKDLHLNK